eukprot:TRINITY_DN8971_c0_g1_i1.p1 TRINITY_DN8971_c0_g1~~TRINITY_DN8971_c0_g1_i1.p1  ORF type:complete len:753 (+),score=129.00 TRINITY_DN8971_c0_g1_i1:102-2261(+)
MAQAESLEASADAAEGMNEADTEGEADAERPSDVAPLQASSPGEAQGEVAPVETQQLDGLQPSNTPASPVPQVRWRRRRATPPPDLSVAATTEEAGDTVVDGAEDEAVVQEDQDEDIVPCLDLDRDHPAQSPLKDSDVQAVEEEAQAEPASVFTVGQRVLYWSSSMGGGQGGWVEAVVEDVRLGDGGPESAVYDLSRKKNAAAARVRALTPNDTLAAADHAEVVGAVTTKNGVVLTSYDSSSVFEIGENIQYWSETKDRWIQSQVVDRRPLDDVLVYDLVCKRGVPSSRLRPNFRAGQHVEYLSDSTGRWMPARVLRVLEQKGACDLNIKNRAAWERLRSAPAAAVARPPPMKGLGVRTGHVKLAPKKKRKHHPSSSVPLRNDRTAAKLRTPPPPAAALAAALATALKREGRSSRSGKSRQHAVEGHLSRAQATSHESKRSAKEVAAAAVAAAAAAGVTRPSVGGNAKQRTSNVGTSIGGNNLVSVAVAGAQVQGRRHGPGAVAEDGGRVFATRPKAAATAVATRRSEHSTRRTEVEDGKTLVTLTPAHGRRKRRRDKAELGAVAGHVAAGSAQMTSRPMGAAAADAAAVVAAAAAAAAASVGGDLAPVGGLPEASTELMRPPPTSPISPASPLPASPKRWRRRSGRPKTAEGGLEYAVGATTAIPSQPVSTQLASQEARGAFRLVEAAVSGVVGGGRRSRGHGGRSRSRSRKKARRAR